MNVGIRVEAALTDDAPALAALHASSFEDIWGRESFETLLGRAQVVGLKAMVNGVPIGGFILTQVIADEAEILTFCVDPALRRTGVGRLLLATVCEALRARGALSVFLEVSEGNTAARTLYAKSGFSEIGRRRAYYRDSGSPQGAMDALVMKKPLAV
jgi:ribosomal-protein-alanine N-acetyltransferase